MGYFKHLLTGTGGIQIYPLISLIVFFLFFVSLLWYVVKTDKNYIEYMRNRPLDKDANDSSK